MKQHRVTKRVRELQIKTRMALLIAAVLCFAVFFYTGNDFREKAEVAESESVASVDVSAGSETITGEIDELSENEMSETGKNGGSLTENADASEKEGSEEEIEVTTKVDLQFVELKVELEQMLREETGTWSIYVKDLQTGGVLCLNSQKIYAASLIKLFVMESCFHQWKELEQVDFLQEEDKENPYGLVSDMLKMMIKKSDNEAYNSLIRLHNLDESFMAGCLELNQYLWDNGYQNTGIYHTLSPSDSEYASISDVKNHTTVEDCAILLEDIYRKTCVSETASEKMLQLLLQQETRYKIPAGVPEGIQVANKTGETDSTEHDAAIVFGTDTDYILCVMTSEIADSDEAVEVIKRISSMVYEYLNAEQAAKQPAFKRK